MQHFEPTQPTFSASAQQIVYLTQTQILFMRTRLNFFMLLGALMTLSLYGNAQPQKGDFVAAAHTRSTLGWGGFVGLVAQGNGGISGGYMLTEQLELGVGLRGNIVTTDFQVVNSTSLAGDFYARYYFNPGGKWQPYLFGGLRYQIGEVSAYNFEGELIDQVQANSLLAFAGVGIQRWITEDLALFSELEYTHRLSSSTGAGPQTIGSLLMPSIGLRWMIGRNRSADRQRAKIAADIATR